MINLQGITWDHPRGYAPLRAVATLWQEIMQAKGEDVNVNWDARSLKDFGDHGLEELAARYDLLIIDHPHMGTVASGDILLPLDEYLPETFLASQRYQSVGPSFESYHYGPHQWALPVDAAAQVAAYREDLVQGIAGWSTPVDLQDMRRLFRQLPLGAIAIPLCPTDCWCTFLSLCAQYGGPNCFTERGVDTPTGIGAFNCLLDWKSFLHPESLAMNPVKLLDRMSGSDEIVYAPFVFGYSNYGRNHAEGKRIRFINPPGYKSGKRSSLLGGAGIGISARSRQHELCLRFIEFLVSPSIQCGLYYSSGGQPAHLQAWQDPKNDVDSGGFFTQTLDTLQSAYVRPRYNSFPVFQEVGGNLLHKALAEGQPAEETIQRLNEQFKSILHASI